MMDYGRCVVGNEWWVVEDWWCTIWSLMGGWWLLGDHRWWVAGNRLWVMDGRCCMIYGVWWVKDTRWVCIGNGRWIKAYWVIGDGWCTLHDWRYLSMLYDGRWDIADGGWLIVRKWWIMDYGRYRGMLMMRYDDADELWRTMMSYDEWWMIMTDANDGKLCNDG